MRAVACVCTVVGRWVFGGRCNIAVEGFSAERSVVGRIVMKHVVYVRRCARARASVRKFVFPAILCKVGAVFTFDCSPFVPEAFLSANGCSQYHSVDMMLVSVARYNCIGYKKTSFLVCSNSMLHAFSCVKCER